MSLEHLQQQPKKVACYIFFLGAGVAAAVSDAQRYNTQPIVLFQML
jgi:hypothetical protein